MADLPAWCCASGCKKCPAWRDAQEQKATKCRRCSLPAMPGLRSCRRCRDASRRYARLAYSRASGTVLVARDVTLPSIECDSCGETFTPELPTQSYCSPRCHSELINDLNSYRPIDETVARPQARILRLLRWSEWLEAREIVEVLGVPIGRDPMRSAHDKALSRLVGNGLLERRRVQSWWIAFHYEYRITPSGIAAADRLRRGIPLQKRAA